MLEIVSLSLEQKERILCGDGNDGDADGKGDADSDKKMMSLLLDHFEDLSFLSLSFDVDCSLLALLVCTLTYYFMGTNVLICYLLLL